MIIARVALPPGLFFDMDRTQNLTGQQKQSAFTLMELMTVIVIVGILVTMLVPAVASMRGKAERASCANNLRGLYAGAHSYVQDHQSWPQVSTRDIRDPGYALAWIQALEKYSISRKNWTCPSVQRTMGNPDIYDDRAARVDYFATPFDSKPMSPFRWPTQPWFIERGDVHGDGNLIIFTNGQLKSLTEVRRDTTRQVPN